VAVPQILTNYTYMQLLHLAVVPLDVQLSRTKSTAILLTFSLSDQCGQVVMGVIGGVWTEERSRDRYRSRSRGDLALCVVWSTAGGDLFLVKLFHFAWFRAPVCSPRTPQTSQEPPISKSTKKQMNEEIEGAGHMKCGDYYYLGHRFIYYVLC
jgi:hypothetical protein